ncbi:MAG TPA: J domain-containing protein [Chloroflexota bacterium]|nr:J domain-containing protein [Chloroflexota bacterium]
MSDSAFSNRIRNLDLYALLEVKPDASAEQIRRAYRRGALACHPDKHPDDQQAAERFVLITQARDVLLDPQLRVAYDRLRCRYGDENGDDRVEEPPTRRRARRGRVNDPVYEQRLAERARRSRSANELARLWQAGSVVVRAEILRNVACPVALFSDPHVEGHWMLSLEAAHRALCPPEVLAKLALSFERSVALAVAAHPGTPAEALGIVATRHRDLEILGAIAAHKNASAAVLREVSRAVRGPRSVALGSAVLAHPACPPDVAQRIRQRLGNMVA